MCNFCAKISSGHKHSATRNQRSRDPTVRILHVHNAGSITSTFGCCGMKVEQLEKSKVSIWKQRVVDAGTFQYMRLISRALVSSTPDADVIAVRSSCLTKGSMAVSISVNSTTIS